MTRHPALRAFLGAVAIVAAGAADAQVVYRCGNEYTAVPCPEGGRVVDATDTRSAAQRAEARRVAALERQRAAQMTKERLAAEAAQKAPLAGGFDSRASAKPPDAAASAAPKKAKKRTAKKRDATADGFTAVDPTTVGRRK